MRITYRGMGKLYKHNAGPKKIDKKDYVLHDSIYIQFKQANQSMLLKIKTVLGYGHVGGYVLW